MLSSVRTHLRRIWGKFPAFVAMVALVASGLVAVDVPEVALAAGTTNCASPNTYTASNGYCTVTFTATGADTWTVPANVDSIDVLVVGGGGAGNRGICSYMWGAGGGGGGVAEVLNQPVTAGATVNITVGAGGAGNSLACPSYSDLNGAPRTGNAGGTSSVVTASGASVAIYAYGGGGSKQILGDTGGGAGGGTSVNGTVTAGKAAGAPGWDNSGNCTYGCKAGGGGGSGAAGSGVNGGTGTTSVITGASYGGGGAGSNAGTNGASYNGGAAGGASCSAANNTGGGGADCHPSAGGGSGGSGIVVIRYLAKVAIGTQPVSQTAKAGGGVVRSLTVSGLTAAPITGTTPTLAYQWEQSSDSGTTWNNVVGGTGATTTSYTLPTLETTALNGYRYRLKITQTSGSITNVTYSNVATLTVSASDASAPTSLTAYATGNSDAYLTWVAPATINSANPLTGYTIVRATSADFSTGSLSVSNASKDPTYMLGNLASSTTYYVKVYAYGTGWTSLVSDTVSFTTRANSVTININATSASASVLGTDYTNTNGVIMSKTSTATNLNIPVATLQNWLSTGNVVLGSYYVTINSAVTWSANTRLTLGSNFNCQISLYAGITATGDTASVSLCNNAALYLWGNKYGAVTMTGANPAVRINNSDYTVINQESQLTNIAATGKYALTQSFALTSTYTSAVRPITFTGELEGLGNSISGMDITVGAAGNYGFFSTLGAGSAVRNFFLKDVNIRNSTANIQKRIGSLAGAVTATSGTTTVSRVYATGFISDTAVTGSAEIGGIIGGSTAGTLTMSGVNNMVSLKTSAPQSAVGGILGANVATFNSTAGTGSTVNISQSWNSGDIRRSDSVTYFGAGGIMGVHLGTAATLTNNYSTGKVESTGTGAGVSVGGILGVSSGTNLATVSNSFTSTDSCGAGTLTNCQTGYLPGAQLTGYTAPHYYTAALGQYLNLGERPMKIIYVQVIAPTNGQYSSISTKLVNGLGDEITDTALAALNLSKSGTPTFDTVSAGSNGGTYQVKYASGFTTGGTAAAIYRFAPWPTATAVTLVGAQTITWTSTAPTTAKFGGTYAPTATADSGLNVSITIDPASSSVCSLANGTVSFIGVGTCTIKANQAGNSSYNSATEVTQTFSVSKADNSISAWSTAPTTAVVNGSTYTPSASATSGGTVTFTIAGSSSSVCSISSGVVSFQAAGSCVILADSATTTNYAAATQTSQTITVGKGTQVISFSSTAPSSPKVGTSYTVTASATSGASVTFSTSSAACSVSGSTVTFNAVGSCVIKANQSGNDNWNAASEVTQTLTVGQGEQSISFTSTASSPKVGTTYTPAATVTGGGTVTFTVSLTSASVCSISGGVVTFLSVGDCVVLGDSASVTNWSVAPQTSQTIAVIKGDQTISFTSNATTTKVGTSYTPAATATAGGSVTFTIAGSSSSVCSIANGVVTFLTVGSCVILGDAAGTSNYNAATQSSQTIETTKGNQTVSFSSVAPSNARYGEAGYTLAAIAGASSSSVSFSVDSSASAICHISNGVVLYDAVGTCLVKANQAGDDNYLAASEVTQSFEIAKGANSLTWSSTAPTDAVVAGSTYNPVASSAVSNTAIIYSVDAASASVCSISNGVVSFLASGDCVLHANQAANDLRVAASEITQTVIVGKGAQSITWTSTAPGGAVVGGATYTPSATGGASGHSVSFRIDLSAASVCSISSGLVRFIGVGDCVINANQIGDANYENAPQVQQTFSVGKGSQLISFTSIAPNDAVVDGASYTPAVTGGASGNAVTLAIASASSAICRLTSGRVTYLTPGDCVIEARQAGNTNYNAAQLATQTVSVAKGAQVISFTSSFTTAKVGGATYTPVATGGASGQPVTFSIDAGSSSICSASNGVISFIAVGNCVINANQAGDGSYNAASSVSQTVAVAKGVQVLAFTSNPPHNVQVQGASYTPTATGGGSGLPVVFTIPESAQTYCTISGGVISFHAVGNCVLYADQAGDGNWNAATRISQVFDVTKGQQVISFTSTAPTNAKVAGSPYTVAASGGAGTAPVTFSVSSVATDICRVNGSSVTFLSPGDCVVVANQAGDANFNAANPVTQTFNVAKGTQTLLFVGTASSPKVDGAAYQPTVVSGGSSSAVVFSSADNSVCEVAYGVVYFHKASSCTIYANQLGDERFESATQISQVFNIAKGTQLPLTGHTTLSTLTLGTTNSPSTVISISGGSGTGNYGWSVNSSSSTVCSITDDVITGLDVGYCDVDLFRAGDDNYESIVGTTRLTVSSGSQLPVELTIDQTTVSYAPNLVINMSLAGGAGEGAVWFESLTPHVCNTSGNAQLNVLHAGTCTVVGHKDADSTYSSAQDTLTFVIQKIVDSGISMELSQEMSYSSSGSTRSQLVFGGIDSEGIQTLSVASGSCTIDNGYLVATAAGSCEVTLTVDTDENYEASSLTRTFTVAKGSQSNLTAARSVDAPTQISYVGTRTTTYVVSGGSGTGTLSAQSANTAICTAAIVNGNVEVTGVAAGSCTVTVTQAGDDNYESASTSISLSVLALPSAPTAVTLTNTGVNTPDGMEVRVGWTAAAVNQAQAVVSGYEVQFKNGANWETVTGGIIAADARTFNIYIPAWSSMLIRVAPISAVDPSDATLRNWTAYTAGSNDSNAVAFQVPGILSLISTTVAAVSSGEQVTLTGTGFETDGTTNVILSSSSSVFASGIRAAAVANSTRLVATVISPTELRFTLPKITMPKGVATLATQVRVEHDGISTAPTSFNYIPKKLAQTLTMTGTLPAKNQIINVGSVLTTTATFAWTTIAPLVTATPVNVCSAALDSDKKLVITPLSPGTCAVSVQLPATPGYTASTARTASVVVKQYRSTPFTVSLNDYNEQGQAGQARTVGAADSIPFPPIFNVYLGENPITVPVEMSVREGTTLFTVNAADDAAGLCSADPGDSSTGNFGSITISSPGDCDVVISQPADSGWYAGETIRVTIRATALSPDQLGTLPQDTGDGTAAPEDTDLNLLDPDTEPAVAITLNPSAAGDYSFGTEDGLMFDPVTKKFNVRSRTALVGTWTATLTSPDASKKWFKLPTKVVKKVQQYADSNICKVTLTVKKDPKLKKKVTRVIGAGCLLSDSGWNALQNAPVQKIKVKYKRIRQYAKTGLSYVGIKGNRVLKNISRTWVIRIGHN